MGGSWHITNPGNRVYFKDKPLDKKELPVRDLSALDYFGGAHIFTIQLPLCGEVGGRFLAKLNMVNRLMGRKKNERAKTLMDIVLSVDMDKMPKRVTKEDTEVEVL